MIKLIISGSRSITDTEYVYKKLNELILPKKHIIEYMLNGMAPGGIDSIAYKWAIENGIKVKECPAKWTDLTVENCVIKNGRNGKYNALAGFNRNQLMAEEGTHLIAINDCRKNKKGTSGTCDMITRATNSGLGVYEVKYFG